MAVRSFSNPSTASRRGEADFVLEPLRRPPVHHTLLVQGDPQIKNYGVDGSAEAYRSVVIPDMIRMRNTIRTPCYGINLGDLVYNDMNVYNTYIDNTEPGEHDDLQCHRQP